MKSFNEFVLSEAVDKGKEVARFTQDVGKQKYIFTINQKNNTYNLNIEGADHKVCELSDNSIDEARAKIKEIVDKVGAQRFIDVVEKNKKEVEVAKNDTDWELYSEYNTSRGNPAFKVYRRTKNGRDEWTQEGKKHYLSIHRISKEAEVKAAIADENRYSKLKHVSGYNHLTDK